MDSTIIVLLILIFLIIIIFFAIFYFNPLGLLGNECCTNICSDTDILTPAEAWNSYNRQPTQTSQTVDTNPFWLKSTSSSGPFILSMDKIAKETCGETCTPCGSIEIPFPAVCTITNIYNNSTDYTLVDTQGDVREYIYTDDGGIVSSLFLGPNCATATDSGLTGVPTLRWY